MKLFPSKKVVTRDNMTSPDPCRESRDFSDPAGQANAHHSAGYVEAGSTTISTDNTLQIFSDENYHYRAQNGKLWRKDRK